MRLASGELAVDVLPGKGADILAITDLRSGIDVLFKTPWNERALTGSGAHGPSPADRPATGDSQTDWLARYFGGWQQLLPNAGAPRHVDGVTRGYHGEAATAAWRVERATANTALLSVDLLTAPLRLTRELVVAGPRLDVRDTVTNLSPDPVEVSWVQHPAFGAPFVDEHCRIATGARTLLTDAEAPGTRLPADTAFAFPAARSVDGLPVDLGAVPAPRSGSAVFAALTDFGAPAGADADDGAGGWFSISSPSAGFGVRLDWDTDVFPHAWFWQECHASPGFPWFRRAYVVAVEPANVLPGEPSPACPDRGRAPFLAPGATWLGRLALTRTGLD